MDMEEGLSIRIEWNADVPVVWVRGELDFVTAPRFRAFLRDLGSERVVLDFSEVTFLDSSGISALIWRHKEGGLTLRCVRPAQMKVLTMTGLDQVFDYEDGA